MRSKQGLPAGAVLRIFAAISLAIMLVALMGAGFSAQASPNAAIGVEPFESRSIRINAPLGKSTLGDFVWFDNDGDGMQDTGEPGVNGVLVKYYLDDGDGVWEPNEDLYQAEMETKNNPVGAAPGWYDFTDVTADGSTYWVVVDPTSFGSGKPLEGYFNTNPDSNLPQANLHQADMEEAVVDYIDADFGYAKAAVNLVKTAGNAPDGQVEYLPGPPSKTVIYHYTLTNAGWVPLFMDRAGTDATYGLVDDLCSPVLYASGDGDNDGLLDVSETWTYTCEKSIETNDPVLNTATATGGPSYSNGDPIPYAPSQGDVDTATIDIVNPGLTVIKTAGTAADGQVYFVPGPAPKSVTYYYDVKNTGDTPLKIDKTGQDPTYKLWDDKCDGVLYASGDANSDGLLDLSETWKFTCAGELTSDDRLVNTATVTGKPVDASGSPLPDIPDAGDTDDAVADIVNPSLKVIKTAGSAPDGTTAYVVGPAPKGITYTYLVDNTGDTALAMDLANTSSIYGLADNTCAPVTYQDGDQNTNNLLDTNEVWTYTCAGTLDSNDPVTNIATATGDPVQPDGTPMPGVPDASDTDDAVADIINPKILIEKTPDSQQVIAGSTVTFKIKVTNVGDVPLSGITVSDPLAQNCDRAAGAIPTLFPAPGSSSSYDYTCTVTATASLTNVATASGRPSDGNGQPLPGTDPVTDDDTADVTVIDAKITIVKTAGASASDQAPDGAAYYLLAPGGPVVYKYVVTNNGQANLVNVTVTDDKLGLICGPFALPIGQSTTCNGTPTNISQDVTNIASVSGTPANANFQPYPGASPVSDTDDAVVDIYTVGFKIEKTLVLPSTGEIRVGENVEFEIKVTNTGEVYLGVVPLKDVFDTTYLTYVSASIAPTSELPAGTLTWDDLTVPYPYGFGMDLKPGESFSVKVTCQGVADTSLLENGKTVNTATVRGALPDLDGPSGTRPPDTTPLPTQSDTEPVAVLNPTGLEVGAASLSPTEEGVSLLWQTKSERRILGFNVLRKDGDDWVLVNGELILAQQAGTDAAASYELIDSMSTPGAEYVLEVVRLDGSVDRIRFGNPGE